MLKLTLKIAAAICLLLLIAVAAAGFMAWQRWETVRAEAAEFDLARLDEMPAVSEVIDTKGDRYGRLGGEIRYTVGIADIPEHLINALIAREDNRFYLHHGVDYRGMARAAWRNFQAGSVEEGASTITQQLARNTWDLPEDKWKRKLVEAALAMRLEEHFSKPELIEAYFNRIYFGEGVYGVETAARIYFGKSTKDLTLAEAAMLAGMIRSPNRLSPAAAPEAAKEQRDSVLSAMLALTMISPGEDRAARLAEIPLTKRRLPEIRQDYAMDGIRRELEILLSPEQLRMGGLRIYTTVDPRLQAIAIDLMDSKLRELEQLKGFPHDPRPEASKPGEDDAKPAEEGAVHSPYLQGALVAVENSTGAIRAIVGGRDFEESPYNRAILAQRQIGSTFKPFVYAAAFERGLSPFQPVSDGEIQPGEIRDAPESWSPKNSDREDAGLQPASWGLVKSRNTMSARVGNWAGLEKVRALGRACGVASEIPAYPSIYLGAFESSVMNLASAYTVFANHGLRRQSYLIEKIEDREGHDLYKAAHVERACMRPESAWAVHQALVEVTRSGTAAQMKKDGFDQPAAGKTGTTDDFKDAWFVGYTSDLTCAVWVGFDKPQTIMKKGYGSTFALPVWAAFMGKASEREYQAAEFRFPGRMDEVTVCTESGLLAHSGCQAADTVRKIEVPSGTAPRSSCNLHNDPIAMNNYQTYPGTPLPGSSTTAPPVAGYRSSPAAAPAPTGRSITPEGVEVRAAQPVSGTGIDPETSVPRAEAAPASDLRDAMPVRRAVPVESVPRGVRVQPREGGMTIYQGEVR